MEKIKEAIDLILKLRGGLVDSKTRLNSILFLIENCHADMHSNPLFHLNFVNYYFGPHSDEIEKALFEMEKERTIEIRPVDTPDGRIYNIILTGTMFGNSLTEKKNLLLLIT